MTVTPIYASLIALLFLVLSYRIIIYRRTQRLSLGDYGDKALLARMRAQANCAEYAPTGLILLLLVELQRAPGAAVHILGLMLLAGRLAHGYGFSKHPQIMNLRVAGTALTTLMIATCAVGLLLHSLF